MIEINFRMAPRAGQNFSRAARRNEMKETRQENPEMKAEWEKNRE